MVKILHLFYKCTFGIPQNQALRDSGSTYNSEEDGTMWTCPKCGRTFKNQNQSHYCGKAPETIDEYIAAQPEKAQRYLREVREAVRAALPEAEERISWSMPTR